MPSTVTVAARPRDIRVFAITNRTGYSNTSARKMPTKTIRNVSPIATNAASTPSVAATSSTVRIGRTSSTRRDSPEFIPRMYAVDLTDKPGGQAQETVALQVRDGLEPGEPVSAGR